MEDIVYINSPVLPKEQQLDVVQKRRNGTDVVSLAQEKGISKAVIYRLLKENEKEDHTKEYRDKAIHLLYHEHGFTQRQLVKIFNLSGNGIFHVIERLGKKQEDSELELSLGWNGK